MTKIISCLPSSIRPPPIVYTRNVNDLERLTSFVRGAEYACKYYICTCTTFKSTQL